MNKIAPNLYVGSQADFESKDFDKDKWSHLLAAKEPWHRMALGYKKRAADKSDPEYLMAMRDNKMILNLIDAPKSIFFSKELIDEGIYFIERELSKGKKVGIFCNKGESRSASIGLLFLIKRGYIHGARLEDCEAEYLKLYPDYNPGDGMHGFVEENFERYKGMI